MMSIKNEILRSHVSGKVWGIGATQLSNCVFIKILHNTTNMRQPFRDIVSQIENEVQTQLNK